MKENYKGLYSFNLKEELENEGTIRIKQNMPYERNVEEPSGIVHTELTAKINMEGKAVYIPSVEKDIYFSIKKKKLNEEIIYEQIIEAKNFFSLIDTIYSRLKENNEKIKKSSTVINKIKVGSDGWLYLNDFKRKKLIFENIYLDLRNKIVECEEDLNEVIDVFQNFRKDMEM